MWRVLLVLTVLTASCEAYTKKHKVVPNRNQRIIKVQGPPHYNHFHGLQKPIRKRPIGLHHGDDFVRPNHPPPIPPFFNGPSVNHKKHLPRPPPHVYHKLPSYGLGFPYKSFRPTFSKDHFRVPNLSQTQSGPVSSSNGLSASPSTTYHSPTFTTSSFVSSPVSHIISSDDNNGPIREIPAPNLAPKPHDEPYGPIGDIGISGAGIGIGGIGGVGIGGHSGVGIGGHGGVGIGGHSGVGIGGHGGVGIGGHGGVGIEGHGGIGIGGVSTIGVSDTGIGAVGPIAPIGGVNAIAVAGGGVESTGHVSHLESDAVLNTIGKDTSVNLDTIVKDPGIEVNTYIKESGGDTSSYGKEHTVEIANFDEGSSIDVTKLIKNAAATTEHNSGYEVTEHHHHNHLPSNDQIIKGHDGTKLYYAPDPDPSLPVHKVPPTNDPHSTPSNGQNVNSLFLQQAPHGFSYLPSTPVGGPVAPLSSQELFHLMHGYPTVLQQPVVAFVSQPQDVIRTLSGTGHNYYQQGSGGHYSQEESGNDVSQYLQQPDIHNLLHNSPKSVQQQDAHGVSHSSVISHGTYSQQDIYSPQNHYNGYLPPQYKSTDSIKDEDFATSEVNHNYQYEPEASESNTRNGLTVIRQTNEGSLNSETVKELLLEDSASNELNYRGNEATSENTPTVLHLKNIPEVPFYASLPSKKAAEALATLQAAGSIASNYMNRIKINRGDQGPEVEERRRKVEDDNDDLEVSERAVSRGGEKTVVEIQQSVPLYESSISSKNLVESDGGSEGAFSSQVEEEEQEEEEEDIGDIDFKEEDADGTFGKRLRPK